MTAPTVAQLLGDCLRAAGATNIFGDPLPGLTHHPVADWELARLLADADGRIGTGPGVALRADGRLRLSSRPGGRADPLRLREPGSLPGVIASWTLGEVHAAHEYDLDLDLDAPAPADAEPIELDTDGELFSLSPSLAEVDLLALAGPGVVRHGQVEGLQSFAAQAGCGVLNTWGAKGVFRWDSPFHFGTGGLQERDAELAGLLDADVVVAVGLDHDESPLERWGLGQVLEVEPRQLAALAFTWPEPTTLPSPPRLYTQLSVALGPLYASDAIPLAPPRAAADLSASRPAGGLVAADPGLAGLWIARTFPTTEPGSVVVPATVAPGFAAAAALVARLGGRPAVGVTTGPVDPTTDAVLGLGAALGADVPLLVWGDNGQVASVDDHSRLLAQVWTGEPTGPIPVPVDVAATTVLVDVAGPVIAWPTLEIA